MRGGESMLRIGSKQTTTRGRKMARSGSKRRLPARIWVLSLLILSALALLAAPAQATVSHAFSHSIGGAASTPPNPYPVLIPTDVEIEQATRDVYVTDPLNHRIEKFDKDGNFLLMFGKEVNESTSGNVCTAASGDTCKAGVSSASPGGFQTPTYLAVDNFPGREGVLYVADTGAKNVSKFNSGGSIISSWGVAGQKDGTDAEYLPGFGAPFGVAVGGPDGNLYVGGTKYSSNVWEYTPNGTPIPPYRNTCGRPGLKVDSEGSFYYNASEFTCFSGANNQLGLTAYLKGIEQNPTDFQVTEDRPTQGFNFDPSGDLYQAVGTRTGENAHTPRVDHYVDCDPLHTGVCELADVFGEGELSGPKGVAVDGTSHSVYVANSTANDVTLRRR